MVISNTWWSKSLWNGAQIRSQEFLMMVKKCSINISICLNIFNKHFNISKSSCSINTSKILHHRHLLNPNHRHLDFVGLCTFCWSRTGCYWLHQLSRLDWYPWRDLIYLPSRFPVPLEFHFSSNLSSICPYLWMTLCDYYYYYYYYYYY